MYTELEHRVARALVTKSDDFSLTSGVAAALVFAARHHAVAPDPIWREVMDEAVQRLAKAVSTEEFHVSLWPGLVGILYSLEYARHVAPEAIPPAVVDLLDRLDEMLADYVESKQQAIHFDLISGAVGFGAYALMRASARGAQRLYAAVERNLLERAETIESGVRWRTWPRHLSQMAASTAKETGHIDFGLAHGQPGVALLLAAGLKHGLCADKERTHTLLTAAVRHLMSQSREDLGHSRYPYYDPQATNAASRLAWCYGDLGVGFTLYCVAEVIDASDVASFAEDLVVQRLGQVAESFGINDHGLCHGYAGVAYLIEKMNAQGLPAGRALAADFRRRTAAERSLEFGAHEKPDLLDGVAGISLSALEPDRSGRHSWDVCLCLGF